MASWWSTCGVMARRRTPEALVRGHLCQRVLRIQGIDQHLPASVGERGVVDLNKPVATYWPEFGQAGKADITLASVLAHRSGVIVSAADDSRRGTDRTLVCDRLAAAEPWQEPGTAQGTTW